MCLQIKNNVSVLSTIFYLKLRYSLAARKLLEKDEYASVARLVSRPCVLQYKGDLISKLGRGDETT